MKKNEIKIIIIALVVCVFAIASYFLYKKYMVKEPQYGYVYYQNEPILKFDINEDFEYYFDGSYGRLYLEVNDQKWRITKEECPNHICSSMGWVGLDSILPITCLPNEVVVFVPEE